MDKQYGHASSIAALQDQIRDQLTRGGGPSDLQTRVGRLLGVLGKASSIQNTVLIDAHTYDDYPTNVAVRLIGADDLTGLLDVAIKIEWGVGGINQHITLNASQSYAGLVIPLFGSWFRVSLGEGSDFGVVGAFISEGTAPPAQIVLPSAAGGTQILAGATATFVLPTGVRRLKVVRSPSAGDFLVAIPVFGAGAGWQEIAVAGGQGMDWEPAGAMAANGTAGPSIQVMAGAVDLRVFVWIELT